MLNTEHDVVQATGFGPFAARHPAIARNPLGAQLALISVDLTPVLVPSGLRVCG